MDEDEVLLLTGAMGTAMASLMTVFLVAVVSGSGCFKKKKPKVTESACAKPAPLQMPPPESGGSAVNVNSAAGTAGDKTAPPVSVKKEEEKKPEEKEPEKKEEEKKKSDEKDKKEDKEKEKEKKSEEKGGKTSKADDKDEKEKTKEEKTKKEEEKTKKDDDKEKTKKEDEKDDQYQQVEFGPGDPPPPPPP